MAVARKSQDSSTLPAPAARQHLVLGGGITGVTAAWQLRHLGAGDVTVVERSDALGGLAGSLKLGGQTLDYGSHRIHEQYDAEVLSLIRELLGEDLLKRPRRGQIRIQDRFVNYPPSILQILGAFGPQAGMAFFFGYLGAALRRLAGPARPGNFQEYCQLAVGDSLYRRFYLPYAEKLWRTPPTELAVDPAMNRMKKFELKQVLREVRKRLTRRGEEYWFYYPRHGFGQIAQTIVRRYEEEGGAVRLGSAVERFELEADGDGYRIRAAEVVGPGGRRTWLAVDEVVSTIPIDALDRLLDFPDDPAEGRQLGLKWRSLRLVYLLTEDKVPSSHETYYFPEPDVLFGRVSEIGMYSPDLRPVGGGTLLAIEIPCSEGDELWTMDERRLADLCLRDLRRLGLCRDGKSAAEIPVHSQRVRNLYPVHTIGWRDNLARAFARFARVKNLFPIGRPALFLHCNTDHCMLMAMQLSRFLAAAPEERDLARWHQEMQTFFNFRIRD